ncbi:YndJ family protein [Thalassobacillus pellis]|uniref:YndJ family protein n=1 Tax=Thalassobacillus pellis TaxID=748008 RepID=UPI001960033F|nr:YndJ family protein [Thalassobacillus pellis]MBM7554305.1 hypothetical protein [Thalassobacillus pellis]
MLKWNSFLYAGIGLVFMILWAVLFRETTVDIALSFCFFVLVPLLLGEILQEESANPAEQYLRWAAPFCLPAAGAGTLSLTLAPGMEGGLWAGVWCIFTLMIAFGGLMRLLGKGIRPIEESVLDVAMIYLAVGGGWLVLAQSPALEWLPYTPIIVQLTAIHFHYAAFLLPILTGVFGRWRAGRVSRFSRTGNQSYTVLSIGILLGPFLVAVGLNQGPPTEVITVGIYLVFILWLCGWWLYSVKSMEGWARWGIALAAALLLVTIGLSFIYSLGLATGGLWLLIPDMIKWHGAVNAFGFSLIAVLSWIFLRVPKRYDYTSFPVIPYSEESSGKSAAGLIKNWSSYRNKQFDPGKLDPLVHDFHIHTDEFTMDAEIQWKKGFHRFSKLSYRMTNKWKQINIPPDGRIEMSGEITYSKEAPGINDSRAWVRRNKQTGERIFTALYGHHEKDDEVYMNIRLPFPAGMLIGVLRVLHDHYGGLILTSTLRPSAKGDEGIYFSLGKWVIRTPLQETFQLRENHESNRLIAIHDITLFGIPMLTITYRLHRK